MKFLIAGLGSIGRRHLRNLVALGEKDILLYRTGKATLSDADLAGFPVESDLQKALTWKPDAVIISNPTAMHLDVAIPAAEAGCHLLLEKPISHNLDRVDQLLAAVNRSGVRVLVGFQFRFHPGLQLVKNSLENQQIGEVVSVRAHWGEYLPNWHPWEDYRGGYAARPDLGGGVVLTLCHPLDYLRMIFGEVASVSGLTSNLGLGLPVEDTAEIILNFASGVVGSVHLDYVQQPPAHWLEVIGTRGSLRWDNADGGVTIYNADTGEKNTLSLPPGFDRNQLFIDEMQNFLDLIHGSAEAACSLDDGVQALKICLQVLNASRA